MNINNKPLESSKLKYINSNNTELNSISSNSNETDLSIFNSDNTQLNASQIANDEVVTSFDNKTKETIIEELESQLNQIEADFETAKNSNGWISGTWDKIKNLTKLGAGSNKTQAKIQELKEEIENLKNSENADIAQVYKNITGNDLTTSELESFMDGKTTLNDLTDAGQSLEKYTEGQKMSTDTVGDIVSGIASVGTVAFCTAAGVCAAPFTAGASLGLVAAGLGIGGATGTVVKTALKASDCIGNEKTYTLKNLGYDSITGFANGIMGPLSNALGGAAGTGVMKAFGMQSLESTVIKSAAVSATGEITQTAAKTLGQYSAKELAVSALSKSAQVIVDSGLSGATDGLSRSIAQGDDLETALDNTIQSTVGSIIAAPVIGGGFKLAGKMGSVATDSTLGKEIGEALSSAAGEMGESLSKIIPDSVNSTFYNISQDFGEKSFLNMTKNCLTDNMDGTYDINIGNYVVKVAKDELDDEILSDETNVKLYQYAQELIQEAAAKEVKLSNALNSCQLGTKIKEEISDISKYNDTEKELITTTYEAIQQRSLTGEKFLFPVGSIKELYKTGQLTETGIIALMDIGGLECISRDDYNFLCSQNIKLTSIDTDYIIKERVYTVENGILDPNSETGIAEINKIVSKFFQKIEQIPQESKLVIVTGHPASGKSTATSGVLENIDNYFNLDPDQFKPYFEEYANGLGSDVVHKASGKVRNQLMEKAIDEKRNLIIETTGSSSKVIELIKKFKELGYGIEIIHINRSTSECAQSMVQRAETTGRVVPPEILLSDSALEDYTTIPTLIHEAYSNLQITTFNNSGTLNDFKNSKTVLQ